MKFVRYADVAKDPSLKFVAGGSGSRRELNMLIAKNVEAGCLVAGFTTSQGNLGSRGTWGELGVSPLLMTQMVV